MRRYLLIINPRAGSAKSIENDLRFFFRKRGIILDVKKTNRPLHARMIARRAIGKYSVVIAGGGDGTINETINGLAGSDVRLGIIPMGTENALAQGLGIPFSHVAAAKVIARGRAKIFDLGRANGRYFILAAGVGLDAKAIADIKPVLKQLLGSKSYHVSAVKTVLTHVPAKLEVWLDDQVLPRWGYFVVIGNVKYYGGSLEITHQASPHDGYLDVCIFKRTDVINMFKYFVGAASRGYISLTDFANIEYFKVRRLVVKSKRPALAHTDAEMIGNTPVRIEACPKAIKIIC
jgi:YegS/Rv2252/BmrU family lipid kinase